MKLFHGNIVYAKSRKELAVYEHSYIAVEDDGIVEGIYEVLPEKFSALPVTDFGESVIIPAFSDLHVHAPQYPQRGLGMDLLLSDWLGTYTFPQEARFADMDYAKMVYDAFLDDLIANGTMHACVFGTIHRPSVTYLAEQMEARGFRGCMGKVNMDMQSPEYLCETPEDSIRETERFICALSDCRYVKPILTPRFAPTCSRELLTGLGKLAEKYGLGVQTHLVESRWEAQEARRLFPDCSCDTEIYEKTGLLGHGPVVGAHFIFPSEEDIHILKKYDGYAVHCPDATVNIIAGIAPVAALADQEIRFALGSDIAGGHLPGVYTQAARAVQLSKLKWFYEPDGNAQIAFPEAFFMATKLGGSLFGSVGSLEKGYVFDALVIRDFSDPFRKLSPAETIERFCYTGNASDILERYMNGARIPALPAS